MPGAPGVSFSPLNSGQVGPVAGSAGSPLQDAIKILSFRLPTVVGASGISPLAGNPGDSVANDWLMKLFQGLMPGGPAAPSMGGSPFQSGMGNLTSAPSAGPSWSGAPAPGPMAPTIPPPVIYPGKEPMDPTGKTAEGSFTSGTGLPLPRTL